MLQACLRNVAAAVLRQHATSMHSRAESMGMQCTAHPHAILQNLCITGRVVHGDTLTTVEMQHGEMEGSWKHRQGVRLSMINSVDRACPSWGHCACIDTSPLRICQAEGKTASQAESIRWTRSRWKFACLFCCDTPQQAATSCACV